MEKITYKCKVCSWTKSIPCSWEDDSPAFCGNPKCDLSAKRSARSRKSFKSNPECLECQRPEVKETPIHVPTSKALPKVDSAHNAASEERKKKRRGYAPSAPDTSVEEASEALEEDSDG